MIHRGIISMLTAVILLAGCTGAAIEKRNAENEKTAQMQTDTEKLKWYVNFSWFNAAWGKDAVSREITDKTNVSVDFVVPSGNEGEKLDALIASDALPDLVTLGWWEPQVKTLIEKGYVVALTKLAEQENSDFLKEADPDVMNWYQEEDGEVYCYPNSSFTPMDYEENDIASPETFVVRKDIYEALGCPDMTTPEGFADAVRAAMEKFPEVDGKPLIPIGVHEFDEYGCDSFGSYLMNFLAIPYEKDGKYYDRFTDSEYLRWMKMFSKLGREGLLSHDMFIDKRVQMEENILSGRYFCMLYQRTDFSEEQKALYENDPEKAYIAVDGPSNSNGDAHTLPGGGINGWTVTMISKNCKDPAKALELITYMMSEEGQKLTSAGIEGEDYEMVNGKIVLTEDTRKLREKDYSAYVKTRGADNTFWMLQNNVMQKKWTESADPALRQMEEWTYPYTVYMGQYELVFEPGSRADVAKQNIDEAWGDILPKLLLAENDQEFDKLIAEYCAEREADDYAYMVSEATEQIKENEERLGIR